MQLVKANEEELGRIVDMVNEAYRGAANPSWTTEADLISGPRINLATLHEIAASGSTVVFAAKRADDELLGCVSLSPTDKGPWYLSMLAVNPATQTAGIGKGIMAAAEQYALEHSAPAIKISVINHRSALISWYERRGYRKTGAIEAFPYGDATVGTPLRDDLALVALIKPLSN